MKQLIKKIYFIFLVAVCADAALAGCEVGSGYREDGFEICRIADSVIEESTVMSLLTFPDRHMGKYVRIFGVISAKDGDERIFLSKEYFDIYAQPYSIYLNLPDKGVAVANKLNGKYVWVEGLLQREGGVMSLMVSSLFLYGE